jgi:hypothetical protein
MMWCRVGAAFNCYLTEVIVAHTNYYDWVIFNVEEVRYFGGFASQVGVYSLKFMDQIALLFFSIIVRIPYGLALFVRHSIVKVRFSSLYIDKILIKNLGSVKML